MATDVSPTAIAERVVEAILAQKLAPGERLGEQALAENFSVSRTMVREALMQLQARGFVEVQSRRGWYVVEPSAEEARDAFSARRIVEAGILAASEGRPLGKVIRKLRDHIADERRAIEVLRDLTARTTLAATLYQSKHEAGQSCAEHGAIVAALEAGDTDKARRLMLDHIGNVERALEVDATTEPDAPSRLRATLAPVALPRAKR
jgi:DNA-binding GntR family transcriptional regulator